MGVTKINELRAPQSRAYLAATLPTSPYVYYGLDSTVGQVDNIEWRGGEIAYNTSDSRLYIQTATSGTTPTWKRYLTQLS